MMTNWGNGYYAYDKGKFEMGLTDIRNRDVCYSDGGVLRLGRDYNDSDEDKVMEFASEYDLDIDWSR